MFVQPSGLIFVVIIAIWAAYLLQHWVRRREHLATARSVDRFSDAMRVLERRAPLPVSDLSLPQPRSYSISPARPSRSEVVVKRAQAPTANVRTRHGASVPSSSVFHAAAGMSARRVRGVSFLASLLLVVVVSPLAAFSVLPWWSVMVVVAALVVDFAWLRHAASTERANRRSNALQRSAIRPTRSPAAARSAAHAPSAPTAQVETMVAGPADGATGVAELTEPAAVSPAEVDLSGWAPVPVPPPTYTLKAKAERPVQVQATAAEPTTTQPSSFDGLVDEGELDDLLDRRRAAGA